MAKKEGDVAIATEEVNLPATIETEDGKTVSLDEMFASMESATKGMEIGADYLKIEEGEEIQAIFVEMTTMNGMGANSANQIDAVRLITKDKRFKINADKVLVSACRTLAAKGRTNVAVNITCKGSIKGPKGSYKDIEVCELILKK